MTAARASTGVLAALALLLAACGSPRLVQSEGQFADCASADCVSSQAEDSERCVKPLRYVGSTHDARGRLIEAARAEEGSEVVTNSQRDLHLRFDGALRAAQDVEFWQVAERWLAIFPVSISNRDAPACVDLEATLKRYAWRYNQHLPQKALNHQSPIQAREYGRQRILTL